MSRTGAGVTTPTLEAVDVTGPWPEHLATIIGAYGVTCRCGDVLNWPDGWNRSDHSAGRLVAFHAAAQPAADSLQAAGDAAGAALPEGWSFWQMTGYPAGDRPARVFARARLANVIFRDGSVPEVSGDGPTPAAALRALAAALADAKP